MKTAQLTLFGMLATLGLVMGQTEPDLDFRFSEASADRLSAHQLLRLIRSGFSKEGGVSSFGVRITIGKDVVALRFNDTVEDLKIDSMSIQVTQDGLTCNLEPVTKEVLAERIVHYRTAAMLSGSQPAFVARATRDCTVARLVEGLRFLSENGVREIWTIHEF